MKCHWWKLRETLICKYRYKNSEDKLTPWPFSKTVVVSSSLESTISQPWPFENNPIRIYLVSDYSHNNHNISCQVHYCTPCGQHLGRTIGGSFPQTTWRAGFIVVKASQKEEIPAHCDSIPDFDNWKEKKHILEQSSENVVYHGMKCVGRGWQR